MSQTVRSIFPLLGNMRSPILLRVSSRSPPGGQRSLCHLISNVFEEAAGDVNTGRPQHAPTRRAARGARDSSSREMWCHRALHPAVDEVCHGSEADCENLMECYESGGVGWWWWGGGGMCGSGFVLMDEMDEFLFLISILLWEIMSVDRKEALNIVAAVFAWQRLIILDITVAGAGGGGGGGVDLTNENYWWPHKPKIYIQPKI